MSANDHDVDVVILGAGIVGTILATVLARGGATVQVLEAGEHPKFTIGESTIPHTSTLFRLIGERYDVPEIKDLATFHSVRGRMGANHGIKRGFNFLYHRPGEAVDPTESHQLPIPAIMHTETHFFRQDLDEWLLRLAIRYGARVQQKVTVSDVDLREDGVTVHADRGRQWRARYLVDATGFRSVLAGKLALREDPCRFRHHSRSMFTHLLGVRPWEKVVDTPGPVPGSESTLHHVFPGGWIWVIPFNNHRRSFNPVVSVGMTVDPRVHPRRDVPPGTEFFEFIEQFPDIRRQFADARPVREWVATGRLQYSSSRTVGHRWSLAMHAAGFLDPLFSRGLSFSMDWIHAFAWRLLDALSEDDFAVERFEYLDRLTQELLDYNDGLVANAYTSFSSFPMWDAWVRIWALGEQLALFETNRSYARYRQTRDPEVLRRLENVAPHGSLPDVPAVRSWFAWAYEQAGQVGDGRRGAAEVAAELMRSMGELDFSPPAFGITDPANRFFYAPAHRLPSIPEWVRDGDGEVHRNLGEALGLYAKLRFNHREYDVREELKYHLAKSFLRGVLRTRYPG